jgi:hypothetical protein
VISFGSLAHTVSDIADIKDLLICSIYVVVEDPLLDCQLALHVVAQAVSIGQHDVEECPIVGVRRQHELGHLKTGSQVHARSADQLKLVVSGGGFLGLAKYSWL